MAETTDRPQGPAQAPPDAVRAGKEMEAPSPTDAPTYQPLSLLAMAAFGLAVIYAFAVLVGGTLALLSRIPMLLPGWTFLLPIVILALCWAAGKRIQNSEGTLSGLGFTVWGSRLAILCGITYAAYYFAIFFAIRGPAIDRANEFFRKIQEGQLEQAYIMSRDDVSTKGMDTQALRDMIESRFNQPMGTQMVAPGPFTRFRQERFVRLIQMDGDKAKIVPTGVSTWEHSKGTYQVLLNYHVITSLIEFDMKVETFGREPKPGEPKGLKWSVSLTRGETNLIAESAKLTSLGEDSQTKTGKALEFAIEWAAKASEPDALKPEERARLTELIRLDDKTFWASSKFRDDIVRRIRTTFQPSGEGKRASFALLPQPTIIPLLGESDGRTTVLIETMLRYMEEDGLKPQYMIQAQLAVSAPSSEAAGSKSAWRVDGLHFLSGRTPPERPRPPMDKRPPMPPQRQT